MKISRLVARFVVAAAWTAATAGLAFAQVAPADPWPRQVKLANGAVLVYQPQVEAWDGNQIKVRAAVALQGTGSEPTVFGSIFATARTQVDKVARTVVFSDIAITKSSFPTLHDQGAALMADLGPKLAANVRTISLDRVEASLKAAGVKPPSFPVKNDPPRIIVSYSTAILVPIDGPPKILPVPGDTRVKRVINTHALILQGGMGDDFYLHVYDGWLTAPKLDGSVDAARRTPIGMDDVAKKLAASGIVDMLDGGPNANPKPLARQRRADHLYRRGADRARSSSRASRTSCRSSARSCCGRATPAPTCSSTRPPAVSTSCCRVGGFAPARRTGRGASSRAMRCRPTSRESRSTRRRASFSPPSAERRRRRKR